MNTAELRNSQVCELEQRAGCELTLPRHAIDEVHGCACLCSAESVGKTKAEVSLEVCLVWTSRHFVSFAMEIAVVALGLHANKHIFGTSRNNVMSF